MMKNFTKKRLGLLLAIALMAGVHQGLATNYYVATTGNDSNNGSLNTPWKTIQKAAAVAGAGDHVYIKKGTYYNNVVIANSGTSSNWLTFDAFPGDEHQVILNNAAFKLVRKNYVRISGMKVQNGHNGFNIEGPCEGIQISNNHTYNTFSSGIIAWGVPFGSDPGDYNNIYNLKILDNKVEKACNGGWNECITLANGVVDFEIAGNEVFNGGDPINGGEGIDLKAGVRNGSVHDNYIHGLTRRGIYLDGGGTLGFAAPSVRDINVYNNKVTNCVGAGMAIMTEGSGDVYNINVYNNLFYENTEDGMMYYKHPVGTGLVYNCHLTNNTIYNNGRYGILINFTGATNLTVRNNISYNNSNNNYSRTNGSGTTSNNLFSLNPLFANAGIADFKLQSGSPAINTGTATQAPSLDYDGNSRVGQVDIGAYEYQSSSSSVAPTGSTIWLQATNGYYVTAEQNITNNPVHANSASVGNAQEFVVEDAGYGLIALKANSNGKYLSATINVTNAPLQATAASIGTWARFSWEDIGNNKVALKANINGMYVWAQLNETNAPLKAKGTSVQQWETFTWGTVAGSRTLEMNKETMESTSKFTVYPNPVIQKELTVEIPDIYQNGELQLLSTSGQLMYQKKITTNKEQFRLPEHIKAGMYVLLLAHGDHQLTNRILVQ
ncbi:T9SS type A sorting domain-containing protein [Reichenbachiella carrageenanivorans]|uniref:T9SS type A sorting domain-containing protein n=1 Tax=Reichenbachiella carrageenanivorans TaxID=2979869 RepID=A0ABY6D4L2_9BACT|nr:choice-of-anchor Q domain-containing protein [Reichenbachiella carrageenanivorans]UXX81082.1 T9SS type A sorting domain-containing protein [Reichenbachiella carrageenanivorans]